MKKLIPLIIVAILILNTTNVSASTNIPLQNTTITDIEYISEDYYIVTTIKDITPKNNVSVYSTAKSITREKNSYMYIMVGKSNYPFSRLDLQQLQLHKKK